MLPAPSAVATTPLKCSCGRDVMADDTRSSSLTVDKVGNSDDGGGLLSGGLLSGGLLSGGLLSGGLLLGGGLTGPLGLLPPPPVPQPASAAVTSTAHTCRFIFDSFGPLGPLCSPAICVRGPP